MDLDTMRHTMATTGSLEIRRSVLRCLAWVVGYLLLGGLGLLMGVGGLAITDEGTWTRVGLGGIGVLLLLVGVLGTCQFAPGLLGRGAVRIDAEGVRTGRRLAPWQRIVAVTPRVVTHRGISQTTCVLTDRHGGDPFRAHEGPVPRWRRGGRVLPRGLVVRQRDLVAFLQGQLRHVRSGPRAVIAPPLHD